MKREREFYKQVFVESESTFVKLVNEDLENYIAFSNSKNGFDNKDYWIEDNEPLSFEEWACIVDQNLETGPYKMLEKEKGNIWKH